VILEAAADPYRKFTRKLTRPFRFRAAWCSVYEIEPVPEVFGEVDVVADSLVEMAEKIIEASKN
jgi:hypothetical protein